jgi:hypothetical protein
VRRRTLLLWLIFGGALLVGVLLVGVAVGVSRLIRWVASPIRWVASSRLVRWVAVLAVVLIAIGVIGILEYYWLAGMDKQQLSATKTKFDICQSFVTIVAIIVGAAWAYFHFFKGRTYKQRLEPEVSGEVVTRNGVGHLLATLSLKNLGLSRVAIRQRGSGLLLSSYNQPVRTAHVRIAPWAAQALFPVFEDHTWIEPGEAINDQQLIVLSGNEHITAFQLRLRIVASGVEWNARDTVVLD